jgi:tRNA C32,U32 (ribose-2'-O)-methylase TrmJ
VLVVAHELWRGRSRPAPELAPAPRGAPRAERERFVQRAFGELEGRGMWTEESRPAVQAALRSLLARVDGLSLRDLGLLRGAMKALQRPREGEGEG